MKLQLPKLSKKDLLGLGLLSVFLILVAIMNWSPKINCEVARPEYECATFLEVLQENCEYWEKFDCDVSKDISLDNIVWYIQNMCIMQNRYHGAGWECGQLVSAPEELKSVQSLLRKVCNNVSEGICPI